MIVVVATAIPLCAEFQPVSFPTKKQFIKFALTRQEVQERMAQFEEEYSWRYRRLSHRNKRSLQITPRTTSLESSITVSI